MATGDGTTKLVRKQVVDKAGGRHLVFRIRQNKWAFLPRPYALISNIEGSLLLFYGFGQLWITHRKKCLINDWIVRVPRLNSRRIEAIVGALKPDIDRFIDEVTRLDVIGTIMVERKGIEFHWTVPRNQRTDKTPRIDSRIIVDLHFNELAKAFARLQLAGREGEHDIADDEISFGE